ncbi:MAG: DUF4012 domain-containing protein [Candidatus Gracilibacteria bacterium]|nr:DUF4012 domain-containing protein [Candidatus Gracilibacteria bacterium]
MSEKDQEYFDEFDNLGEIDSENIPGEFDTIDENDDFLLVDEFNRLNDIQKYPEEKNIDISSIFNLSKLGVVKKLSSKNILDLNNFEKKDINLFKKHILQIKKNTITLNNLYKFKNYKTINLRKYEKKEIFKTKTSKTNILNLNNFFYFKKINFKENFYSINFKNDFKIKINNNIENILIFKNSIIKKQKRISKLNKIFLSIFIIFFSFVSYGFYLKSKIISSFENLNNITNSQLDFNIIDKEISSLKKDFFIINIALKPINFINYFIGNNSIKNLDNIVGGTLNLLNFITDTKKIVIGSSLLIQEKGINNIKFSQFLKNIEPLLEKNIILLDKSLSFFNKVDNLGNEKLDFIFKDKLKLLNDFHKKYSYFLDNREKFYEILGDENEKTYMIAFQNNDEIRPNGGFMGSAMFVTILKGKIINIEKKDIYALEYLLKPYRLTIKAPEGINKLTQYLGLRDSNYFFDNKSSSEQIKFFLDKTPYKIDGIIYINQNIVRDFLNKNGGYFINDLKKEITGDNFSMITSTIVETKLTKTEDIFSTPKQFLFDFVNYYKSFLINEGNYVQYSKIILESFLKNDISVYLFGEEENIFLENIGLIKNFGFEEYLDFNYPYFTSISGNKSDRYIKREIKKDYKYNIDCSIDSTLEVNSTHNFSYKDEQEIKSFLYDIGELENVDINKTLQIQGKGDNIQYLRIILPKEAIISPKKNMTISEKKDYKEVGYYLRTPLNSNSKFILNYSLENKSCQNYSYKLKRQPGLINYFLNFSQNNEIISNNEINYDFIFN